ncbi:cell division protein FtsQ/DivIB [Candidatus Pelagibacter sp. HIMB1623]|uniref:cell division protein FtsQ/DivIB n=2 Tax=unclassified Candidatus Pelagibacter TaxID=2647897 RepID=UPI003F8753EE
MHQRISRKIVIYLLIFFLVSSIGNYHLISFNSFKKVQFTIVGLDNSNILNMTKNLNNLKIKNIFFLNKSKISEVIESDTLVENYSVFKKYPSNLTIQIKDTNFLAKINVNNKIYIVGSNGKLINNNYKNDNLPFIFGKPEIDEFLKFKKLIDESKFSYDQIKNLYFFPSKRWDVELNNKVLLKLSKKNIKESLNQAFEFFNNTNFKEIKLIDARIKNQITIK